MKIVIAGLPKSGTTALFYKIKNSLPRNAKGLFEPFKYIPNPEDEKFDLVAKILFWPNRLEADYDSWGCFDKKIMIIRDPRDRYISEFLYIVRHSKYYMD